MNNLRTGAFLVVALAVGITGGAVNCVHVGVAALVPVAYAVSTEIAEPYPKYQSIAGGVSILSFCLLVASVAVETPSSDLFDLAWYGYVSTSIAYAALMRSAPLKEGTGWLDRAHRIAAYVALVTAIAFSCAVAARAHLHSSGTSASLAIAGAILSTLLDGWFTAGWFFVSGGNTDYIFRGRFFGFAFIVSATGLFTDDLATAILAMTASFLMIVLEASFPIRHSERAPSLLVRSIPFCLAVASVWLPHLYGLISTAVAATFALITAVVLLRPTASIDRLLDDESAYN
jgi:hypothetical protein